MKFHPLNPTLDVVTFNQAEATIHHAAQFLAMVGKNYIEQQPDDSNTNLAWNEVTQCIEGRRIDLHYLSFHLPSFSLKWMDDEHESASLSLHGQSKSAVYDWIKEQLENHGQDSSKLKYVDHYEIPPHPIDDGEPFSMPSEDLLTEWMHQRNNANQMMMLLNEAVGEESEIRIWPHHFDTGTYYAFGNTKAVGAGWAMADTLRNAPYLYIYPWEQDRTITFSDAPELTQGSWLDDGWTGAVLDLALISHASDPGSITETFIREVVNHFKSILNLS